VGLKKVIGQIALEVAKSGAQALAVQLAQNLANRSLPATKPEPEKKP
jgi:hypothetical protein